jgi:Galactose oxidase, central domain
VLLFGGQNATNYLGDAWEWNGTTWSPVVHGPSARGWPTAAAFDGQALVFGGFFASSVNAQSGVSYGDAWTWDGVSWSNVAGGPPARNAAVMGATGVAMTLFSGTATDYFDDTWLFDGNTWSQPSLSGAPPGPRVVAASAVYQGSLYVFGGSIFEDGGFAYYGDLWKFTGTGWTNVTPTSGPAPTPRGSVAMSVLGGKLVLYGGGDNSTTYDETWEFDGTSWTNKNITGPGGRTSHAMATFGSTIVLFGGWDPSGTPRADTWLYDGTSWTNAGATGPGARATHVMVAR